MRSPLLTISLVESTSGPGLAPRLGSADRNGAALRPALMAAGFVAGDRVTLALEGDRAMALFAASFFRQIRSGEAQKDPRAFVQHWMSVVAEVDGQ